LVGESEPFLRVIEKIPSVAPSDATVLLSGETGTGKGLVARAIHYQSPRKAKPFVPVNCGALPDHLIENELFGHVKGAFTGASSSEKGLLAEAEGGTLVLDEVDTLSLSAQVKLLRFLQDREYRPLGCPRSRIADVRVIAATNADLGQQLQANQFREDLYYRLNPISLHLPRLRERIEDIPLLADHFLSQYGNRHGRGSLCFAPGTLQKLTAYPWPGNVRELEGVIQRAVLLTPSPSLQPNDIELPSSHPSQESGGASLRQVKARAIEQVERAYLIDRLATHTGNVSRAAKGARMDRRAFQRLLRKHGLDRRAFQT
jgi:DNA-binding NtrC family response regulator